MTTVTTRVNLPHVYRPSANPPVTAWARHLDQVMRDRQWSRVRLFEEIGAELGYAVKSRSAILPLLEDRDPTPEQAAVLRRYFGDPLPEPEPVIIEEPPTLASALIALAEELRLSREARVDLERRLAALEPVVKRLAGRALEGSPKRRVPDGTKG